VQDRYLPGIRWWGGLGSRGPAGRRSLDSLFGTKPANGEFQPPTCTDTTFHQANVRPPSPPLAQARANPAPGARIRDGGWGSKTWGNPRVVRTTGRIVPGCSDGARMSLAVQAISCGLLAAPHVGRIRLSGGRTLSWAHSRFFGLVKTLRMSAQEQNQCSGNE
jgi:hypothetical protein